MFLCRTSQYYIVHYNMDHSYGDCLRQVTFDGTSCMRSSNDTNCKRSSNDTQVDVHVKGEPTDKFGQVKV